MWPGSPGVNDIPAPADFDNDGVVDLVIYDRGDWWIEQSSDGLAMPDSRLGINLGTTGCLPIGGRD